VGLLSTELAGFASSPHCQLVQLEDSHSCRMVNKQWIFCTVRCCSQRGLKASTGMYNSSISIPLSPKRKGRWFWNGTPYHFDWKFTKVYWKLSRSRRRLLQQILLLNQRSFKPNKVYNSNIVDLKGLDLSWFPLKDWTGWWWVQWLIIQQQNPTNATPTSSYNSI
jgi:hypothetical protein